MSVTRNITIKLEPSEIASMIVDHLKKEGFVVSKDDVDFKVSNHVEGIGMGEHVVLRFDHCDVKCTLTYETVGVVS